ncbi:Ribosomal-protein-serine acetyltransferase [compost metagenome]
MHIATSKIETGRLLLRPFEPGDAMSMLRNWIGDPKVQYEYGEPVYDSEEAVMELLRKWTASYAEPEFYRWAMIRREDRECIGQIAFCSVDTRHYFADIEYCVGRSYQGNGYASEALRAVIAYTFSYTSLNRLQAFHRGRNQHSARVLQKSGMIYEGTLRQSFYYEDLDEYDDRVYYGICKEEADRKIPVSPGFPHK